MPKIQHLKNAPIIEAILDIRVKPSPRVKHDNLAAAHLKINNRFPIKEALLTKKFTFKFEKEGKPHPKHDETQTGYLFKNQEEEKLVQYRLDGFTYNKLKPYKTWEKMRDEAKELWNLYVELAEPEAVTRIALRFINKVEFSLPIEDILTAPPAVPESLPQELSSFLTRVTIREPKIEAAAILTQAFEGVEKNNYIPIILDIDVFKVYDFDPKADTIWDSLEQLRDFKNDIFFECLTEKAMETFK